MQTKLKRSTTFLCAVATLIAIFAACAFIPKAYAVTVNVSNETELQTALAGTADTINLTSDVSLSSSLIVPSGRTVTITADGHQLRPSDSATASYTSGADTTLDAPAMIVVDQGGTLTLGSGLTVSGAGRASLNNNARAMDVEGIVNLDGATISQWNYGSGTSLESMIKVYGPSSQFNITNGSISNNTFTVANPGAFLYALHGAHVTMSGGSVSDNTLSYYNGSSTSDNSIQSSVIHIGVDPGTTLRNSNIPAATFDMTGGTISNNKAWSTVFVGEYYSALGKNYAWLESYFNNAATMNFSGDAKITNNTCAGAGGVCVWGCGQMNMSGGEISSNTVLGYGGGILAYDGYTTGFSLTANRQYRDVPIATWSQHNPAGFHMTGGVIQNNTCTEDSSCGGGLYLATNEASIEQGTIQGNKANQGGGMYVASIPYKVYIPDAVVTNNTASTLGGGLWLCPSGGAKNSVTNGVGIFNNTAQSTSSSSNAAGDDVVSLSAEREGLSGTDMPTLSLDNHLLGNDLFDWYKDGGVANNIGTGDLVGHATDDPRYADETPAQHQWYGGVVSGKTDDLSLKSVVSDDAVNHALNAAQVSITNNTAAYGGGIGCNGEVDFGINPVDEPPANFASHTISVTKVWDSSVTSHPDSVTVDLKENGRVVASKTLSDDNSWTCTFENIPGDLEGHKYVDGTGTVTDTYTVEEEPVDGFTATVSDPTSDATNNAFDYTITNTSTSPHQPDNPGENPDHSGENPGTNPGNNPGGTPESPEAGNPSSPSGTQWIINLIEGEGEGESEPTEENATPSTFDSVSVAGIGILAGALIASGVVLYRVRKFVK